RPDAYHYATSRLFRGVPLRSANVLEIGSGGGLLSLFMAGQGARVVSLEPEGIGSTPGVIAKQRERSRRLGLQDAITVIDADFNTWDTDERFDVIVSRNSLNHLYASEHHALRDPDTRDGYLHVL